MKPVQKKVRTDYDVLINALRAVRAEFRETRSDCGKFRYIHVGPVTFEFHAGGVLQLQWEHENREPRVLVRS